MATTSEVQLRAVLLVENGAWVVQCLDYDIAAQADTPEEVIAEFRRVLLVHIFASTELQQRPFLGMRPAPKDFFKLFEGAADFKVTPIALRNEANAPLSIIIRNSQKQREFA